MPKRKISETDRLRKNLKQQIRRMEKRGFEIPENVKTKVSTGKYQTLKSLSSKKYKKLYSKASAKNEGKTETSEVDFSDLAGTFDPETGEKYDTSEQRSFYESNGYNYGGEMSPDLSAQNIIDNVISELVEKLEQPTPEYWIDGSGKRHYLKPEIRDEIDSKKTSILNILNNEISSVGETTVAQRLQQSSWNISDLAGKLESYYDISRNNVYTELVSTITGRTLDMQEMGNLDATTDMINGYNEPE